MADDSTASAADSVEYAHARPPKKERKGVKTLARGKRTRSESNLGLKPTNKRKKAPGQVDDSTLDVNDTEPVADNDEVEALKQEKQRLLTDLRRYTVLGDSGAEATPPPPTASLSRRNSQTSSTPSAAAVTLPLWSATPSPSIDTSTASTATFRHWDFLLQEMQWMSTDFAQERKWRHRKAKTLSLSVAGYHNKKATANVRTQQQEEQARKRFAAKIGRDVKKFWLKVDKLVAHEVKTTEEEKQKALMESQLQFLLQQTEKYAAALATTFESGNDDQPIASLEADARRVEAIDSDEDFEMDDEEDAMDDETTIAAEEQLQSKADVDFEVAHLRRESTMSIDALRAQYAAILQDDDVSVEDEARNAMRSDGEDGDLDVEIRHSELHQNESASVETVVLPVNTAIVVHEEQGSAVQSPTEPDVAGNASDEDFEMDEDDADDDETTIEEEERAQSKDDVDMEVALLNEESTMSIEALRAKYAAMAAEEEVEYEISQQDSMEGADDDDPAFECSDEDAVDDEMSIEAAERLQSKAEIDHEIAMLNEESSMSIEQLRAKYFGTTSSIDEDAEEREDIEIESDDDAIQDGRSSNAGNSTPEHGKARCSSGLQSPDNASHGRSISRTGSSNTDTDDVWSRVGLVRPFLLRHTLQLRAYQATGVGWLLSLARNRMNGILADEMGLGKTIQTISMLASLATEGTWGPHLVVVPTSCILNWEMEFKRWCPGFKIMTYYGSAKRRKELRLGWSKVNAFQVCITSYQLVVADAPCFKRKKWYYMILDEAHNIKNWKSQRWQTLLTFNTQRRLLLTGTPLQNNLMELWALMHFLMPHLFRSRAQFSHWFNNPLNAMVEGEAAVNEQLITRLHNIIRPFVLRRLKKDVAKQMPGKFEHIVMCSLSKRQRFLYEDFMARSSTRKALTGGNFMGMMNVLMQLRKVCNHPDLFESRPIMSPFDMPPLQVHIPFTMSTFRLPAHRVLNFHPHGIVTSTEASRRRQALAPSIQVFIDDVSMTHTSEGEEDTYPDDFLLQHPMIAAFLKQQLAMQHASRHAKARSNAWINYWRCLETPFLSQELLHATTMPIFVSLAMEVHGKEGRSRWQHRTSDALASMVSSPKTRLENMLEMMLKVLCFVHKARSTLPNVIIGSKLSAGRVQDRLHWNDLDNQLHEKFDPVWTALHPITQRQHLFFPDKRLIQFDCGKLQQLDRLLRDLKRDGHRCLIFSQMSSMLNILEIFLNVHGHTYFRLDGSTPVEQRQRLMDKFNGDSKVFCFILSTRSGGLGINLTGADTVIFYDSDWNPAMDAQAQDRAHRIGQTRDVHIYRMVSEHTVEENILKKAQQKRQLDFLVLSEGQFTTEYFTKSNLRDLLGTTTDVEDDDAGDATLDVSTIEDAMAQCEDQEDVAAMKGVKQEQLLEKEQDETFDDDVGLSGNDGPSSIADTNLLDTSGDTMSLLRPIDRYAMTYRSKTDPLFLYIPTPDVDYAEEEIELERIEANKVVDEEVAIQEGELIVAADSIDLSTQKLIYMHERSHVKSEKRRRALTGVAWMQKTCVRSNLPFYYNTDTHEAVWDRPRVLIQNEEHAHATQVGYGGLSLAVLLHILGFARPVDRISSCVNKQWTVAARHVSFYKRILTTDAASDVQAMLATLQTGETVQFGSGVHQIAASLHIYHTVRLVGPSTSGSTCTLEFDDDEHDTTDSTAFGLVWHAKAGEIANLTLQKSTASSQRSLGTTVLKPWRSVVLTLMPGSACTVTDSRIVGGDVGVVIQGGTGTFVDVEITGAIGSGVLVEGGFVTLLACLLSCHGRCGLTMLHGAGIARKNSFQSNARYGIRMLSGVQMAMLHTNSFANNRCGAMDIEHSHRRIYVRHSHISHDMELTRPHVHDRLRVKGWAAPWVDRCDAPKPKQSAKKEPKAIVHAAKDETALASTENNPTVAAIAAPQPVRT
ncbi:hypothetical protein, variant [Aphanomyces invadans]|uniref:Uncharacterized protein n=1 Tax=Aphanomyces invadans TaxID=157072 RepID=A0A024TFU8_9STRA|nr:hypothetical protein, variant [Aphanomyces invadans]ETV92879.1 hypothetical protein, variant [Aphanomyces invadans]|eukprot:XP_008878399.1 hypothetical protein, variant [Aphanomyces invadans]